MNCQPGDIAIVVNDEPGCEANIGRLVLVKRPSTFVQDAGFWWEVEPLGSPLWVCYQPSLDRCEVSSFEEADIAIEDQCLRPLRGLPGQEGEQQEHHKTGDRVKEEY